MQKKAMIVSFLAGVATTVAMGVMTGAAVLREGQVEGRFKMEVIGTHAFVIDTATGQVWEKFLSPNSGQSARFADAKLETPAAK